MADTEPESIRDTLSAAFQAAEAPEAPAAAPSDGAPAAPLETTASPEESSPVEAAPTPDARARDEKGRFHGKASDTSTARKDAAPQSVDAGASASPAAPASTPAPTVAPTSEVAKAPQSWRPEAREVFAQLPKPAQAEVLRRESEFQKSIQENAEARTGWQSFQKAVAPYESMIRAEGGEPLAAVQSLLQTAAALRTAPPAHKARLVAQMVTDFGVSIEALDAALSGQPVPQGAPQGFDPTQLRQQLKKELLSDFQAEQQQRAAQAAVQEIAAWADGKEFYTDVKPRMATFMKAAAEDGQKMTLDEAYALACQSHPEISKVLSQRKAAEAVRAGQAQTQQLRAATSSVKARPTLSVGGAEPQTTREYLEAAFEAASGR